VRKKITTQHTHTQHNTYHWGGKRWARRGGMAMVQDTQGKRWKSPQVNRIPARPARVLWCPGSTSHRRVLA
jgi:hypothetical protein